MTALFSFFRSHDDLSIRYAIRPCRGEKKAGSIILLGGRGEFIEKYAETIAELNQRFFDVYAMDWRGQGLSSRQLPNRHKGYVRCYGDYLDDLSRFVREVIRPQALSPHIILAHSMGGHVALRFLHDHPDGAAKAVLVAPMIDIAVSFIIGRMIRMFTRLAVAAGLSGSYITGSGDYTAAGRKFEGNRLTSDPQRFMDEHKAIAANSDLALGGATFGWLKASLESIDILKGPGFPEAVHPPVLIVGAGCDRIVSVEAQKEICGRLPHGRIRIIRDARHEVLKENNRIRTLFWQEFDRFIDAPADASKPLR